MGFYMISIILAKKILSLFIIMVMSMLLVRKGILKADDSRIMSVLQLFLFFPCVIIHSFQVDFTEQVKQGLLLGTAAAIVIHTFFLVICKLLGKYFGMEPVEKCSVIYTNSGNLMIPIVTAVFGPEWIIYTSSYMVVQLVLFWTHLKSEMAKETQMDWKAVITNYNMIAVIIGFVLLMTGYRLPDLVNDALAGLGSMVGPAAMIIAGMLLGEIDLKKLMSYKGLPSVVLFRLVIVPLLCLVLLKYCGMASFVENSETILLITLLACATPSATTVVSMASIFGENAEYASAINVATSILCIFTMPVIVAIYQL